MKLFRGRGDVYGAWHGESVKKRLLPEMFQTHLCSPDEADWFGVYNVVDTRCSWGCVDIDVDDRPLANNVRTALQVREIPGWVERTTRGFHVWVFPHEALIDASTMRRALTAACRAIGYSPKEVFPKQDKALGGRIGNYVRLPYNGVLSAGHHVPRAFMEHGFYEQLAVMHARRTPTFVLERLAATLPVPSSQDVHFSVDIETGVEVQDVITEIGGLAYRVWRDGPLDGSDRSNTLAKLAHLLAEGDVPPEVAYTVVASADQRWGKRFLDRGAAGTEIIAKIVRNAYQ
jgi:hypothetical protein